MDMGVGILTRTTQRVLALTIGLMTAGGLFLGLFSVLRHIPPLFEDLSFASRVRAATVAEKEIMSPPWPGSRSTTRVLGPGHFRVERRWLAIPEEWVDIEEKSSRWHVSPQAQHGLGETAQVVVGSILPGILVGLVFWRLSGSAIATNQS